MHMDLEKEATVPTDRQDQEDGLDPQEQERGFEEWIQQITTSDVAPILVPAPNMFPCTFCGVALDLVTIKRISLSQHHGECTVPFIMSWTLACGHNLCARCLVQQVLHPWCTKVYRPRLPMSRPKIYRWENADKTLVLCIFPDCGSVYTCVRHGTTWKLESVGEGIPVVVPFHHFGGYKDECGMLEDLVEHGDVEVLIDENWREWGPLRLRDFRQRRAALNS